MLEPGLASDGVRHALLTAAWLLRLAASPSPPDAAFAAVPASAIKGAARLVTALLAWDRADLVSGAAPDGLPIAVLVESLCSLLVRRDLVSSPLTVAAMVDALHAMLRADRRGGGGSGAGLGRSGSAAHDALVGAVLGHPASRALLVPALVAAYPRLDAVEGLDVDADDFDKFTVRNRIAGLLQDLWGLPECADSVAALADADADAAAARPGGGGGGQVSSSPFADFARAALLDLMYLLEARGGWWGGGRGFRGDFFCDES